MTFDKKKIAAEIDNKLEDKPSSSTGNSPEAAEATRMFSEPHQLNINTNKAWYSVQNRINTDVSHGKVFLRVAAVITLLMVSAVVLYFANKNSDDIYISNSQSKDISLNDGTQITLNTNTKLKVEQAFGKKSRKVFLEGEAYFEVSEDQNKPFIAETENAEIKVLGTSFNIDANKSQTVVYVNSGSVEVRSKNNEKAILQQGQKVVADTNGILVINSDENEIAWQSRILVFDNDPISEVVSRLSELHGVVINYDQKIGDCMVTIKFDNTSLTESLKLLGKILPIKIQRKNKEYFISGKGC